jgi:hypothetical protein
LLLTAVQNEKRLVDSPTRQRRREGHHITLLSAELHATYVFLIFRLDAGHLFEGLGKLDDTVQSSTTDDGIHYKYNDIDTFTTCKAGEANRRKGGIGMVCSPFTHAYESYPNVRFWFKRNRTEFSNVKLVDITLPVPVGIRVVAGLVLL